VNISDLLRQKHTGRAAGVVTISPTDSVSTLLAALAEHNVGALLAVDDSGVLGIVSERDVVRQLARAGAGVLDSPVADIMTTSVVSCSSGDAVHSVAEKMTERRIRHMPVIDDGALVGIVSIGDVVAARINQLEQDRVQLEQYISS
jgi:CBS domain-containing protein